MYGIFILVLGWVAMTNWVFAWFANPLFLFAVFRSRVEKPGMLLIVSIIAFGLGLSSFAMREIPNYGSGITTVAHLAIGYYIWMVSLGLLVCYAFLRYRKKEVNPVVVNQVNNTDLSKALMKNAPLLIGLGVMLIILAFALLRR